MLCLDSRSGTDLAHGTKLGRDPRTMVIVGLVLHIAGIAVWYFSSSPVPSPSVSLFLLYTEEEIHTKHKRTPSSKEQTKEAENAGWNVLPLKFVLLPWSETQFPKQWKSCLFASNTELCVLVWASGWPTH